MPGIPNKTATSNNNLPQPSVGILELVCGSESGPHRIVESRLVSQGCCRMSCTWTTLFLPCSFA